MPALVEQRAIAAIVLAVVGLVIAPLAVWAWVLGIRSARAIEREPTLGGRRTAVIAIALSVISIGWWSFILIDQLRR